MKITSVHFAKLINLGNYENQKIAAWAQVGEDESPEAAVAALQQWVEAQLDEQEAARKAEADAAARLSRIQYEIRNHEHDLQAMRTAWEQAVAFLERAGIAKPPLYIHPESNPFLRPAPARAGTPDDAYGDDEEDDDDEGPDL